MTQQNPRAAGPATYAMTDERSRGRLHDEQEHPYRGLYQRDRDRIVHSTAFRRLEYKTQVFVNHEGDFYRTRLTHTFEVSQISRTFARILGLNEDLTEAIALAHDLGHTPFGHAGETALNHLLRAEGGFEHNLHGLRVVDRLENRYAGFPGLNLSFEVREAFIRHHTPHDHPGLPAEFAGCGSPLLEVQATIIADEIAYDNHDIDDGLYSGILEEEALREQPLWKKAIASFGSGYDGLTPQLRRLEGVRRLINLLVTDVYDNSRRNLERLNIRTVDDVRAAAEPVLGPSPEMAALKRELETFLRHAFYRHYRVTRMAEKCKRFLCEMFTAYVDDPRLLPTRYQDLIAAGTESPHRIVADYVAGMTDRYAEQEYQKLFQPEVRT